MKTILKNNFLSKSILLTLTTILASALLTSCAFVSGETVTLTIRFNPEAALTKAAPNTNEWRNAENWSKVVLYVFGRRGKSDVYERFEFERVDKEPEISVFLTVPAGNSIRIDAEVYFEHEVNNVKNDILLGYGSMDELQTITRENSNIYIELCYSTEVRLHLDGGNFFKRIESSIEMDGVVNLYVKQDEMLNKYFRNEDLTKQGHTFTGWRDIKAGNNILSPDGDDKITEDMELWAEWEANTYQIILDFNDGTGDTDSVTATFGEPMPTSNITAPTKTPSTCIPTSVRGSIGGNTRPKANIIKNPSAICT